MALGQMGDAKLFHDLPGVILAYRPEGNLLENRRHKELVIRILVNDPHLPKPLPVRLSCGGNRFAGSGHLHPLDDISGNRLCQPGQQPQQCSLSAAVLPQKQQPLPSLYLKIHILKDLPFSEGYPHMMN